MSQIFEDAFTDAQANIVALSLDLLESGQKDADKLYMYAYQDQFQTFYHAFFEKNGKIIRLDDYFEYKQIVEYLSTCSNYVDDITDICDENNAECPHEFKLIYDIRTKAFDADYNYDSLENDKRDIIEIYEEWCSECEMKLSK